MNNLIWHWVGFVRFHLIWKITQLKHIKTCIRFNFKYNFHVWWHFWWYQETVEHRIQPKSRYESYLTNFFDIIDWNVKLSIKSVPFTLTRYVQWENACQTEWFWLSIFDESTSNQMKFHLEKSIFRIVCDWCGLWYWF